MKKTIGTTILATTLVLGLFATEVTVTNDEQETQTVEVELQEEEMETTEKQNIFQKIHHNKNLPFISLFCQHMVYIFPLIYERDECNNIFITICYNSKCIWLSLLP